MAIRLDGVIELLKALWGKNPEMTNCDIFEMVYDLVNNGVENGMEFTEEDFQRMADEIIYRFGQPEDEDERDEIKGAVDDLASTTDEVIEMMEYYLNNGDPDIDYLHLSYF